MNNNIKESKIIKEEASPSSLPFLLTDYTKTFLPSTFAEVDYAIIMPKLDSKIVAVLNDWIKRVLQGHNVPLVLYGATDNYKTMMAAYCWTAIAPSIPDRSSYNEVSTAGTDDNIFWVVGNELPDIILTKLNKHNRTNEQEIFHISTTHFGVFDDLDKCPPNDAFAAQLFGIINERTSHHLPTIITINLTPKAFVKKYKEYGKPILSRLQRFGGIFIRIEKPVQDDSGQDNKSAADSTQPVSQTKPPFDRNAFLKKMREQTKTETSK